MNGLLHFVSCATLGFGPHAAYYQASQLSEERSTYRSFLRGCFSCVLAAFLKIVLLATFVPGSDTHDHDVLRAGMQVCASMADVGGMWWACDSAAHRSMSLTQKWQAIGLGWAFADSAIRRLVPLWLGCMAGEYSTEHVYSALQSNINIVSSMAFAAVACLVWSKRGKPAAASLPLRALLVLHAAAPAVLTYVGQAARLSAAAATAMQLVVSLLLVLCTAAVYRSPVKSA